MSMKTFKYRLYPTKKQTDTLLWTLDRCRELYNAALQERKEMYKYTGKGPSYFSQSAQLPEIKDLREEYRDIYAQVLQDTLKRVQKSFDAFFRRVKSGDTPGFPRYQGKHRYDSFTFPQSGFSLGSGRIALSKIGHIKIKMHREMQGKIKTCTIKREGNHWYVCFACEVEPTPHTSYIDDSIGIDLGVSKLATLSTGDVIENPKHYRRAEKKLAKAQRELSRKKRGSNRRKKAVQKVARIHRKTRNQRNDYLHKWSRWLVDTYETIVFEDIAPANLSKAPKPKQNEDGKYLPNGAAAKAGLNKSILDAGWSQFISYCQYKAVDAGTAVELVNPRYTSQMCSNCGAIKKKELSERWHSCECGCELDRDHNAAINIARLGQSLQGQPC